MEEFNVTDFKTLHEDGPLQSILNYISNKDPIQKTIDGIGNFIMGKKLDDSVKRRQIIDSNIARTSRALTAVFPVIVSKSIGIEQAVMISKAVERKCVSMLQMLFAANQITTYSDAKSYLNQFHKNVSSSLDFSGMSIDDFLEYTQESTEEISDYAYMIADTVKAINEDVKNNIHHVLETDILNAPISEMCVLNELHIPAKGTKRVVKNATSTRNTKWDPKTRSYVTDRGVNVTYSDQITPFTSTDTKNMAEIINKQVLDTDIRKANEAQPSLMIVNFVSSIPSETGNGSTSYQTSCVIGVKAMIHYVDPQDIVNRVILKKSDSRGLFNLIRATTREISFFKDFLFAVNRAKVDAVAKSGRGSTDRIWKLLELRADRLRGAKISQKDQASNAAITTLVISRAEVDYIKQFHRIDLAKPGVFNGILRGYNMMAGVIIDEVSERADFLWDDGTGAFESLSFMSLEREETGAMYKKVINLAMRGR